MADLSGKDYRALRRLSDAGDVTLAEIGATCERVPTKSLAALLASGKIKRIIPRVVPEPAKEPTR